VKRIKTKVLVVDDDTLSARTICDILEIKGYEPFSAATGMEGLALLNRGFVNLVLLDLQLPDIAGLEVLGRIKKETPATEAIILTGYAALDSAIEAINIGAFSYLQKPYEMDHLLLHIRRAVEKQRAEEELRSRLEEVEQLNKVRIQALFGNTIRPRHGRGIPENSRFMYLDRMRSDYDINHGG